MTDVLTQSNFQLCNQHIKKKNVTAQNPNEEPEKEHMQDETFVKFCQCCQCCQYDNNKDVLTGGHQDP